MSAFLGPIHIKMYNRVLNQDAMTGALLSLSEERGWAAGLRAEVDKKAPAAKREPLEGLIDGSNIHGWLNKAVQICETRFALVVGGILSGHPERLSALEEAMEGLGREADLPKFPGAEETFQAMHDVLLDGMPCDFPFDITASDADQVTWEVAICPHEAYWDGGVATYYQLRDRWVKGALEGSAIIHSRENGIHTLRKG